jgi:hypothetical protein
MLTLQTRRSITRASLMFLIIAASTLNASACSVPVFRYALEQWQPDAFEVVIFHDGKLTDEQNAVLERLEPQGLNAKYAGNLFVHKIDLSQAQDATWIKLWEEQDTKTTPWMLVLSPPKFGPPLKVLAGPVTNENADLVLSSPKRTEITKRILKGDSVVWVLIDSGDEAKDKAAHELLKSELTRLQSKLKLPEIDPADIAEGALDDVEETLKLQFSLIRLARDDPQEKAFLEMLLNSEPDLRDDEFKSEPMAIPVFGRARALYALIGKGIAQETIEDACVFLTGACQCTVKRQNPGVDLLTNTDWDSLVDATIKVDESTPTLTGLAGFGTKDADDADTKQEDETDTKPASDAKSAAVEKADDADAKDPEVEVAHSDAVEANEDVAAQPAERSVGTLALYIICGLGVVVVGAWLLLAPR